VRPSAAEPILSIRDLAVQFTTEDGIVKAVDGITYDVYPGETLGIVGESGSGKSVSTMSILGLIPQPPGKIVRGEAYFNGKDLLKMSKKELRHVRGSEVSMVFQDPMTSLNPVLKVGYQIGEAVKTHHPNKKDDQIKEQVVDLLRLVGVPNPERRYEQYPHEFSGGMRQRAMIAMAISNSPQLLIADEPTTALVEYGDVHTIFESPRHPYTVGLMDSLPRIGVDEEWLRPIPGQPPSLISRPPGCPFHPRCFLSQGRLRCREEEPPLKPIDESTHLTACHFAEELEGRRSKLVEEKAAAEAR
jgi:oligopeptide/dipeptide ABC transporter ATP-binding protein